MILVPNQSVGCCGVGLRPDAQVQAFLRLMEDYFLLAVLPGVIHILRHAMQQINTAIPFTFLLISYDLGFSFFSFHRASRPTPETFTTLKRTPGISPLALPLRPNPARSTSSFSSTKLRQPSFGTGPKFVQCYSLHVGIYD